MSAFRSDSVSGFAGLRSLLLVVAAWCPVVALADGALTNGANHTGVIPVGGLNTWTFQANDNDSITVSIGEVLGIGTDPKFLPRIRLRGPDGATLGDQDGSHAAEIDTRASSTGTYTVLVSTAECCTTQVGPGNYVLTLAKTPGPYAVSANDQGGPLTNGANHTGAIPLGDLDAWTFQANDNDSITVSIGEVLGSGTDPKFLPRIRLRGPDGAFLGDSDGGEAAEIDKRAPTSGTYTVLVSTAACCTTQIGTANYTLTLAKTPGPYVVSANDQGGPLTNGANHTGAIPLGDLDAWTFQANDNDSITVSIGEVLGSGTDPKFLPRIRLRGPNGAFLGDSDGGEAAEIDTRAPTSGTYTVLVSTAACCTTQIGTANYTLTLAKTPGPYVVSANDQGGPLTNGANHTGAIPLGDLDAWTFQATTDDSITVSIGEVLGSGTDPKFLPRIRLRGPNGAFLGDSDGGEAAEIDTRAPTSGTYTVLVSTAACCTTQIGTANYSLTVAKTAGPYTISSGDQGGPMTNATNHTGAIPVGDIDAWTFVAASQDNLAINIGEVLGSGADPKFLPRIRLRSPSGAFLGDSDGDSTAQIAVRVPMAGTFTVLVSTAACCTTQTGTANYVLTVTGLTTTTPLPRILSFTASPSTITAGQSATLSWSATDATSVAISTVSGTRPVSGSVSVSPTATTTYILTATGPGGTATATRTVTVNPVVNAPSIGSLTANPSSITAGQSSSLSWTTTNATTVSISGISGTQPVSGSVSVSPATTTTYTLTATGPGGTATATTTITINPVVNAPSIGSFNANPSSITAGQSAALSWTTTNATTVSISGISGTQPVSGSVSVSPAMTTTYTLTATGPGGTATATRTVTVNSVVNAPSIGSFTANPSSITAGQSSSLSWTTTNATTVSISGISGTHPVSGSVLVSPATTTTYTLTTIGSGGTATATTTVVVNASSGTLSQLRFSFGDGRRRAVRSMASSENIIHLAKRTPDEQFVAPVTASINGAPFTDIDIVDGVLTLSGAPADVSLEDWLPRGSTARVSITNGDSNHVGVTLSRSSEEISIATQSTSVIQGDARRWDGETTPVRIELLEDRRGAVIKTDKTTWIVIHGRKNSSEEEPIRAIAEAIKKQRNNDQVLLLDWRDAARPEFPLDPRGEHWIQAVGQWAAGKLHEYGFAGSTLNLVGHSWGSYVADELAEEIGGVNVIVALDPAADVPGLNYDPDEPGTVNFREHSKWALTFHSSDLGSEESPFTAHVAFAVGFLQPVADDLDHHGWIRDLFTSMLRGTGEVSKLFTLDRLLDHSAGPWQPDRYHAKEAYLQNAPLPRLYEGVIMSGPASITPTTIRYIDTQSGQEITTREHALTLSISSVTPTEKQTVIPGLPLTFAITVVDSEGVPVRGVTVSGMDYLKNRTFDTDPTNERGVASYTTIVPFVIGAGTYGVTFTAGLAGSPPSAPVSRYVKVVTVPFVLNIASVTPTATQPMTEGESTNYSITVIDGSGIALSGVAVSVEDQLKSQTSVTQPTDSNGMTSYTATVPAGTIVGTYGLIFTASRTGYTPSAHVARSVQVTARGTPGTIGTLSPASPSCIIPSGSSSCNVTLTWTTTNPVGVSQVVSNTPTANTIVSTGNNSSISTSVPHNGRMFYLYNNGVELDSSSATASCAFGSTWNGSKCQSGGGTMSGTLTPASPSCTIASGASSCNVSLSWTTTNPVDVSKVTSNYPSTNFVVATGNNSSTTAPVPYGGRSFYLYNNNMELDSSFANASCASGTAWNGSICQGSMSGNLTPSSPSCTIGSGSSTCNVSLSWTTTNPVDVSQVTSNYPSAHFLVATGNNGNTSAPVPHGGRSFYLYNNGLELDSSFANASCTAGTTWNGNSCQGTPVMSGTLTPASPSCIIASGSSTCNVSLSWTTTNPIQVSQVTSNYPNANFVIATGNNSSTTAPVPHGGRSFYLYNNGQELDSSFANASCASGTSWNGSKCQGTVSGSLTPASPSCTISSGSSTCNVSLSWTTTNPIDVSKVTSNYPSANFVVATGNNSSTTAPVPYGGRSFYLYNNGQELDSSFANASCASGTSWNGSKCQGTVSGSLTPASPSCTISSGASTCDVSLSWTTTNPIDVSKVTSNYPSANFTVATGNNSSTTAPVPYGGRSFYLYNNGQELDSSFANASCASGTSWNGSKCQGTVSGSLTPASLSCTISSGSSTCNVSLSWTTSNAVDVSKVTSNYPSANYVVATGNNSSTSAPVPYGGRSFYLYNNGVELDSSFATASCASGTTWNGSSCQGSMAGNLSPSSPSCTISSGSSTCNVSLSWTTTNAVDVSKVTSNYPSANYVVATGNNSSTSAPVPYGGRSFYLYNNGVELDSSVANASCASGTSWNGSKCQGSMSGNLSPSSPSCTISSGSSTCSVSLSWTTTNPVDVSKITSNYPSANYVVATGNNSSTSAPVPYGGRSFYLYNNGVELDSSFANASCASGTSWNGSKCQGAMSGNLSPLSPSCTISSGSSTCSVSLSWTTTNPVDVSRVTSNYPSANYVVATGNNSSTSAPVPYGGRSFYLYNNGVELDSSFANASCASGTSWNGSKCQGAMSGNLSPSSPSCTISSGSSTCNVSLSWTTTNPVGVSKVTSNYPTANFTVGTGNNNSVSAPVPFSGRSFFLYNNGVELDSSFATARCTTGTAWNGTKCL